MKTKELDYQKLKATALAAGICGPWRDLLEQHESLESLTTEVPLAEALYRYAFYVLKGPFPAGEKAIADSALYSYLYAREVLQGPFPAGEPVISTSALYSYYYAILSNADLSGATLLNADLTGADLTGADLAGVKRHQVGL